MNGIIYRLASLISVILFTATLAVSQTAVRPSGSGTAGDPYVVSSLDNLAWIQTTANDTAWGSHYVQTANIDATPTSGWNSGMGLSPIGNLATQFSGTYNGGGHTISGLFISRSDSNYVGLFGYTNSSAVIESVGVADVNITGLSPVGGLVGFNSFSTVSGCFSTGSVNGTSQVGGLVGWNYQSSVSISYGTASVNGGGEVGGLIGMNSASSSVRLSYSAGGVSGSGANVGGFVGYNSGSTVDTCFWDIQISGIDTSAGGGTGDSTAAMKNPLTFSDSGWSPVVWNMGDGINNGYPYLRWQNTTGTQLLAAVSPDSGVGTSGNPYLIATLDNLYWIYQKGSWSAHYEQTADINASSDSSWNSGKGFYPIGITGSNSFTGSYEGQNHTISGLYVKIGTQYEGLFGYTTGSTLKNVRLVNCRIISAGGSTGGLVGEADNTTVTACSVSGSIGASGNDIGGLIGTTGTGTSVSKCYAEGTITATNLQEVGGLIGITSSGGSITDCYVTDSLNVGDYGEFAGGLVGQNDGTISDCYSTGCVTGGSSGFYVAGFVGYNGSTVSKCFWNTDSSGATGIGGGATSGAAGVNTANMQKALTFTDSIWDFTGTWAINAGVNGGFPYLIGVTDYSLPVQATGFVATSSAGSVTLSWNTQSEFDNAGFNILRQQLETTDQGPRTAPWQLISSYTGDDSLRGLGTGSTGRTYDFSDDKVISGDTYNYKIQSLSTSGVVKDLSTLSVTVDVPKTYALYQNYPNPFNPTTVISYELSAKSQVALKIYDILGREVATLVNGQENAGVYKVNFNAAKYASGVYLYRIVARGNDGQNFVSVKKAILLK